MTPKLEEREGMEVEEEEANGWEGPRPPHEMHGPHHPPHMRQHMYPMHRPQEPKGLTHEDLADMIDAKFERVFRELKELRERR